MGCEDVCCIWFLLTVNPRWFALLTQAPNKDKNKIYHTLYVLACLNPARLKKSMPILHPISTFAGHVVGWKEVITNLKNNDNLIGNSIIVLAFSPAKGWKKLRRKLLPNSEVFLLNDAFWWYVWTQKFFPHSVRRALIRFHRFGTCFKSKVLTMRLH